MSFLKKIFFASIFLGVALLGVSFFWPDIFSSNNLTNPQLIIVEDKKNDTKKVPVTSANLISLMDEEGASFALERLREEIKINDELAKDCHPLAHDLGHAAYEHYGSFSEAMRYQDEVCNSGYLHGIIESEFLNSKDLLLSLESTCPDNLEDTFLGWECYHGIGHGLMYFTENDLPKSLEYCDQYSATSDSDFARDACTNGVFMENFNVDQKLHVSKFVSKDNMLYPCPIQKEPHKQNCYFYAPTFQLALNENNYAQSFESCSLAEAKYVNFCFSGVGAQAMKENINKPKVVEKICDTISGERQVACIMGMSGLYLFHHGAIEPAKAMCERLNEKNRFSCLRALEFEAHLF